MAISSRSDREIRFRVVMAPAVYAKRSLGKGAINRESDPILRFKSHEKFIHASIAKRLHFWKQSLFSVLFATLPVT